MPELPEVETTCRGIAPYLIGRRIDALQVRQRQLRWPVPRGLSRIVAGQTVQDVGRRAKYLLLTLDEGCLIIHLGMSGSLRIIEPADASPLLKHDHIELRLETGYRVRYCDPRRFGAWLWTTGDPLCHPLLATLGPEPLGKAFGAGYLASRLQGRRADIKTLVMDNRIVVGVGNIYANEALFRAGINPTRPGQSLTLQECQRLVSAIRSILRYAIRRGGTTLRDFVGGDGQPGYFAQELNVYGRDGQACRHCGTRLLSLRQGQRATVFCPRCQP